MAQTTTKLPIKTETSKPASILPWPPFEITAELPGLDAKDLDVTVAKPPTPE
jgi:HSP20 family molecular chaperone IbpA